MLRDHIAAEGITPQELARRCEMHATQLSRLLDGKTQNMRPDTLRRLHRGTGIPMNVLIVASGLFTAAELGAKQVEVPLDPRRLSNETLLGWVRERMVEPSGPGEELDVLSESVEVPAEPRSESSDHPSNSGRLRVAKPEV